MGPCPGKNSALWLYKNSGTEGSHSVELTPHPGASTVPVSHLQGSLVMSQADHSLLQGAQPRNMVSTVGAQLKGIHQLQPQPTAQGPRIPGRCDQIEQSTSELEDGSSKISHSDRNKGGKWRSMGDLWTLSIIRITITGT